MSSRQIAIRPGQIARAGVAFVVAATLGAGPFAGAALAHGAEVPPEPDALAFLLGWQGDPLIWLPVIAAVLVWRHGVGRVNRAHPSNPVPGRRTVAWMLGLFAILVALDSGVERYDTTLFAVHMVQHVLLTLVAAPLLMYAGPITLLLRASSAGTRRRWILPLLHARVVRLIAFPAVAWIVFAGVMWGSHFSPLFEAALENEWLHRLEHGLFLSSALLFWWPVAGPDPSPWRMRHGARVLYVGLQMPQNTFLAVVIAMSSAPLYNHYVTQARSWGPTPLQDQQLAGSIMWLGGDAVFVGAVILLVRAWMRDDERRTAGEDRRLEGERAAIRERELTLAARRTAEGSAAAVSAAGVPADPAAAASAAAVPAVPAAAASAAAVLPGGRGSRRPP